MDMRTVLDYYLHAPLAKARQVHGIAALILEERTTTHSGPRLRSPGPRSGEALPDPITGSPDPVTESSASSPAAATARPTRRRRRKPTFTEEAPPEQGQPATLPEPEAPETYGT